MEGEWVGAGQGREGEGRGGEGAGENRGVRCMGVAGSTQESYELRVTGTLT